MATGVLLVSLTLPAANMEPDRGSLQKESGLP